MVIVFYGRANGRVGNVEIKTLRIPNIGIVDDAHQVKKMLSALLVIESWKIQIADFSGEPLGMVILIV